MATHSRSDATADRAAGVPRRTALLASVLVGLAGLVDLLAADNELTENPYVVWTDGSPQDLDISGWAQLHLIVGLAVVVAAMVIATGRRWTPVVGFCVIAAGVTSDILFMPFDPLHSLTNIGLETGAVLVLLRHRRRPAGSGQGDPGTVTGSDRPPR